MHRPLPASPLTRAETARERFSRTGKLPEIGEDGRHALNASSAFVAGLGGTGCAAARLLAGAGLGTLGVADPDRVELSNLPRQILYAEKDVGRSKGEAALEALKAVDPTADVRLIDLPPDHEALKIILSGYDVLLDCTDHYPSRFALHDAARAAGIPYIHTAAEGWAGYTAVFGDTPRAPCLRCFLPEEAAETEAPGCSGRGVIPPLPSILGAIAATEALKYLSGAGELLSGRLLRYDALSGTARVARVPPDPDCRCRKKTDG